MYFFTGTVYIDAMSFIKYLITVLLSLDPSYSDKETWTERTVRMEIIAVAIDDASSRATCSDKYDIPDCKKIWPQSKKNLAILLVTKGFWESRFAKNVHEGKCQPYECDSYRVNGGVRHRARSPWQIQKTGIVTGEEYKKMSFATIESTTMSANVATRYLSVGMKTCNTILGTMAIYGGANSCTWPGVIPREAFYRSLNSKTDAQIFTAADTQKLRLDLKNDNLLIKR